MKNPRKVTAIIFSYQFSCLQSKSKIVSNYLKILGESFKSHIFLCKSIYYEIFRKDFTWNFL